MPSTVMSVQGSGDGDGEILGEILGLKLGEILGDNDGDKLGLIEAAMLPLFISSYDLIKLTVNCVDSFYQNIGPWIR